MAVAVSKVTVELREVVLRDKPPELIEASAKATVPVLVLTGASVIDESLDIMHWALCRNDPEDWLAAADFGLIAQNDGPFKAALDGYKYPHRYGLDDGVEHRDCGLTILCELDARLRKHRFLAGAKRSLTDIAIFPFIRQYAATDQSWFDAQPLPDMQHWLNLHLESDLFADIMKRYPRWQSGDTPTIFP